MLSLYVLSALGGSAMAAYHALLIKGGKSVHHGEWLASWCIAGFGLAMLDFHHVGWAVLASVGMAAVFSSVFRTVLNKLRGLPWSYMGPGLSDTSTKRSQYDLHCWRIAARLSCQPVAVAIAFESLTAILVAFLIHLG